MSISSRGFDPRSALFFLGVPFFSPLFCLAPCGFTTECSTPNIVYCTTCVCIYLACTLSIQSAPAAAAAALCVAILLLLLQLLLLAASVRHRVPDGKMCCWFIGFPVFSSSSFKHDYF